MSWFFKKTATPDQTNKPARNGNGKLKTEPRLLQLGWLGLKVADVVDMAIFMEQTLNLRHIEEGNTIAGHHVRYDCGTLELELVEGGTTWATRSKPRQGAPDIPLVPSFAVDHIQLLAEKLAEREVLTTQIYEQGWTAGFFLFDTERNLWQVHEKRTEPDVGTDEAGKLTALWLACADFEAQVTFYRDVLGLPLAERDATLRPITAAAEQYHADVPEIPDDALQVEPEYAEIAAQPVILQGAVFFGKGTRLALSPGGTRLPNNAPRVWGKDTAFLPGLLTDDFDGFARKLTDAGITVSSTYRHIATSVGRDPRLPVPTRAFRFYDPEGQPWQVYG